MVHIFHLTIAAKNRAAKRIGDRQAEIHYGNEGDTELAVVDIGATRVMQHP